MSIFKNRQDSPETESALYLNRVATFRYKQAIRLLLEEGKTFSECLSEYKAFRTKAGESIDRWDARRELESCREKGIRLVTILDDEYPYLLKNIPDPPLLLYVRGRSLLEFSPAVAIVGTRHPSFYGLEQARRFAGKLSEVGFSIVSGMARGIDGAAHSATLEKKGGKTLAVLGCGVDQTYPREHKKLYQQIAEEGALLSEYALGMQPLPHHFPNRNRILSGLSQAVLVVEAHERSGTLITAYQALEQGREVFAIPGPIDQITSRGTHKLIREGARLVEYPEEIQDEIPVSAWTDVQRKNSQLYQSPKTNSQPSPDRAFGVKNNGDFSGEERHAIEKILEREGALDFDSLADRTGLNSEELNTLLLRFELEFRIRKQISGEYTLC